MIETEVRFLDVDKVALLKQLTALGAKDHGEVLLEEIIFYDPGQTWRQQGKVVRLRKNKSKTQLAFKHHTQQTIDGAIEVEFEVSDLDKAAVFLEHIGLKAFRCQEKRRHTFRLGNMTIDIDTWPRIPTYVELEGDSEVALRKLAAQLGLDWSKAVYDNALRVIELHYNIPVGTMRWFTFERFE